MTTVWPYIFKDIILPKFQIVYVITYKYGIFVINYIFRHIMKNLAQFLKEKRKENHLTQEQFAERAGVALTVVRKIEQGKENLNLEKVNQALRMFGHVLAPVSEAEISPES